MHSISELRIINLHISTIASVLHPFRRLDPVQQGPTAWTVNDATLVSENTTLISRVYIATPFTM